MEFASISLSARSRSLRLAKFRPVSRSQVQPCLRYLVTPRIALHVPEQHCSSESNQVDA
jgi:hypothetical protein